MSDADGERCARCGRAGALPGRVAGGRVCGNCLAVRASQPCAGCGERRPVGGRDSDGRPWCARCRNQERARAADEQWRRLIIDAVTSADLGITAEAASAALTAAAGSRLSLRLLAEHLASHPDALTMGPTSTLAPLDRLVAALAAAGARVAATHPVCERCGRRRRWQIRTASGGLCSSCCVRTHRAACSACGKPRHADRHDSDGRPVCLACAEHAHRAARLGELAEQITAAVTAACPAADPEVMSAALERVAPGVPDRARLAALVRNGLGLAQPAHRQVRVARLLAELRRAGVSLPSALCEACGGPAEPLVIDGPIARCQACEHDPRCGDCRSCGTGRVVLDDTGRCRRCRDLQEPRCARCGATGPRTWLCESWLCHRCALGAEFDARTGPPERLPAALAPLRAAVTTAGNFYITRTWLQNSRGGLLLARLAAGDTPITHEALDEAGGGRSVEYLRALLVAAGALPDTTTGRRVERLGSFAAGLVAATRIDAGDAKIVRAWLRWQVLPRLRRRAETGASMAHSLNNARRALRAVLALLETIHRDGSTLATLTQADVDRWFAQPTGTCWLARGFLSWARDRRHLPRPVTIPPAPPKVLRAPLDHEERWAVARRLVTNDTIPADDRVAAALLVLYGQPLTRIARLARDDVHHGGDGTVLVVLDGTPVPIHEPFATLIIQLPARRTNGVADQIEGRWLFPGRHAGRPVGPLILAKRLRALGISPAAMRNAARAQLAAEIPPAMLGELIGVGTTTASRWAALASGNWLAYATAATPQQPGGPVTTR